MDAERPIHVVSFRALTANQLAMLEQVSPRLKISQQLGQTSAELSAALTADVDVVYTLRADFEISHAERLGWVQFESAGIDQVHDTPLWRSIVQLTSANGTHCLHTPEFAFTTILAYTHHMRAIFDLQRQARWATQEDKALLVPEELRGKTLGIIGYGAIGREIARLAQAFGMRILATQREGRVRDYAGWTLPGTGDPHGAIPQAYYTLVERHGLLAQSDIIVLTLPLTAESRGLIGAAELASMRPDALLVNISRGGLVDHAALEAALRTNRLAGAILDVTDPEPLPAESPLWGLENVLITPHIAGMSRYYQDRVIELFAENLRRYLSGQELLNVVQRDLGY